MHVWPPWHTAALLPLQAVPENYLSAVSAAKVICLKLQQAILGIQPAAGQVDMQASLSLQGGTWWPASRFQPLHWPQTPHRHCRSTLLALCLHTKQSVLPQLQRSSLSCRPATGAGAGAAAAAAAAANEARSSALTAQGLHRAQCHAPEKPARP